MHCLGVVSIPMVDEGPASSGLSDALKADEIKARLLDATISPNQRKKYRKKLSRLFHVVGGCCAGLQGRCCPCIRI